MVKEISSFLLTKYSIVIILVSLLRSLLVRSSFGNYTIVLFGILLFIFFVNYTIVLFGILLFVNSFTYDPFFCCLLLPIYNAYTDKQKILKENKYKSGIYMFKNLINGKRYVGSSSNLSIRFREYLNINYLIRNNYMYIYRALLKHDYSNFKLEILEYCEISELLIREKYYIDLLGSEYNTVKDPTLSPMSGRTHSDESSTKMSDITKKIDHSGRFKIGENHPNFGLAKILAKKLGLKFHYLCLIV
jgi:hypothetical protein